MLILYFVQLLLAESSFTTSTNETNVLESRRIGPWSEILEDWIVTTANSGMSRISKVMKLDDKVLTVSTKGTQNKRDVSETDIYLLGKDNNLIRTFSLDHFTEALVNTFVFRCDRETCI